jgi:hypothetical protein
MVKREVTEEGEVRTKNKGNALPDGRQRPRRRLVVRERLQIVIIMLFVCVRG